MYSDSFLSKRLVDSNRFFSFQLIGSLIGKKGEIVQRFRVEVLTISPSINVSCFKKQYI